MRRTERARLFIVTGGPSRGETFIQTLPRRIIGSEPSTNIMPVGSAVRLSVMQQSQGGSFPLEELRQQQNTQEIQLAAMKRSLSDGNKTL